MAAAETVMRVVAGQAPPEQIMALVERLCVRSAAHQRAQADALLGDGRQLPDAALTLRELSALRYGVDPLISACYARALDLQYPVDPPESQRGRRRRPADMAVVQTTGPTAPTTPMTATKHTAHPNAWSAGNGGGFGWDGTPQPKPV